MASNVGACSSPVSCKASASAPSCIGCRPSSGSPVSSATTPRACSSRSRATRRRSQSSPSGSAATPHRWRASSRCRRQRWRSPERSVSSSSNHRAGGGARTLVPPDVATCDECMAEVLDPADRRFRYPFTNCTNCGPRFTIIGDLPYDRPATTMAGFAMCPACLAEYHDPADRRYHAQPNACPVCGPRVRFEMGNETVEGTDAVLVVAHRVFAAAGIVAVKGIGGYHLACDAGSDSALRSLRERKGRSDKPFALMVPNLAAARALAEISEDEAAALVSPARPIVLLRRRSRRAGVVVGRAGQPAAGCDAAVHALAPPALRTSARCRRRCAAGAGAHVRKPVQRADLHRRRGCTLTTGGPGRCVPHSRPADPRAVRRLGDPHRRRQRAARPPIPRLHPVAGDFARARRAHAGRRRRTEEHVLHRQRPPRVGQPAHRRHGEPGDVACVRANRRRVPADVRREARR